MEYFSAALSYTKKPSSLCKEFGKVASIGARTSYDNTLDVGKAHERMKAEGYLMLQADNDLSEITTALFETIRAWTQFHPHSITYLNGYRIVVESYTYCKEIFDEELWRGAIEWFAEYEGCERVWRLRRPIYRSRGRPLSRC